MMTISATGNCVMPCLPAGRRYASCVNAKRTTQNAQRKTHNAVTFIELLLIIGILGVLVGVSFPLFKKSFQGLQLDSSSRQLQAFMNYLHERAIVERKIIHLNFNPDAGEYWAEIKGETSRLKTYRASGIKIESAQTQVAFYPDGNIDAVTIKLTNRNGQSLALTTEGVFGGVKLQPQQ